MGQKLGVLARKEQQLITDVPIYAEEESYYALANIFLSAEPYLSSSFLDENLKQGLQLNSDEENALLYNNVLDFADDQIQYHSSINKPLPDNFRAIKLKYNSSRGVTIYATDFSTFENWSSIQITTNALSKIKAALYLDLKSSISKGEDEDYKKYSYDNLGMLQTIIRTFKIRDNADEIAFVYAPC